VDARPGRRHASMMRLVTMSGGRAGLGGSVEARDEIDQAGVLW
jgi:hypothetical protein